MKNWKNYQLEALLKEELLSKHPEPKPNFKKLNDL
jgi:hypothetical protein